MFDYRSADLSDQERLLCDFAIKLTLAPASMDQSCIDRLLQAGYSDEQITVATQVIGYFNYINRVADGLGVDAENWMVDPTRDQWEQQRGQGYLETVDL